MIETVKIYNDRISIHIYVKEITSIWKSLIVFSSETVVTDDDDDEMEGNMGDKEMLNK